MRKYNFNERLTWQEFEELSCEVVQRRENVQIQTFKRASDGGKDGHWFDESQSWVVQVKHYANFKTLYSKLANEELDKVRKLNPDRYILVVSLELQEKEQKKIYELFKGYIHKSEDLITARELNSWLALPDYRDIEMQYKNLWLTDYALMVEILKEILGVKSEKKKTFEHEKVLKVAKMFVSTWKYEQAKAQLEQNHTVIVSGEPGMGKTTIARMLAFEYLGMQGMDGYVWVENLEDVESKWNEGQKQVFVLDDFWGSIFHNENRRRVSKKLEDLIYRIKEEKDKRLIITSREYIVQQEICKNPELQDVIHHLKLECVLQDYSRAEKAKILFAHLEGSGLDYEYVKHIFWSCDRIICHSGYSPRIIEKFLNMNHSSDYTPADYVEELLGYLEYPENFWKEICEELSEEARIVAMIIAISYTPIFIGDIKKTYGRYIQYYSKNDKIKQFDSCISELEKTIISTYWDEETEDVRVIFDNPSIEEFFHMYIDKNQDYYVPILCRISMFYNQLLSLIRHVSYHDEVLRDNVEKRCVEEFYDLPMKLQDYGDPEIGESWEEGSDWTGRAYSLLVCSRMKLFPRIREFIRDYVEKFFIIVQDYTLYDGVNELINFVGIVEKAEQSGIHFDAESIMTQYLGQCSLATEYDYFEHFEEIYPELYRVMEPQYTKFMKLNLKDIILDTLVYFEDCGFDVEIDFLIDSIPDMLHKYKLRYTEKYKQEIKAITGRCHEESTHYRTINVNAIEKKSQEEEDYEKVKEEGFTFLFGKDLEFLEDEEIIINLRKLSFPKEIENGLTEVVENHCPWYIYEVLRQERNLPLLKELVEQYRLDNIFLNLQEFMLSILLFLTENNSKLLRKILFFCADYVEEMAYREDAILAVKNFEALPSYEEYIKDDKKAEEIIYTHIFVKNGNWVEILNEEMLLFSYCFTVLRTKDFEWDIVQDYGMPKIVKKDSHGKVDIYQADFGEYVNYDWKRKILLLFQEMDKERLYAEYVVPIACDFLQYLKKEEDCVLFLLEQMRSVIEVDEFCDVVGGECFVLEEVELLEILGISDKATNMDFYLTKEEIKCLKGRKSICKKRKKQVEIAIYKEKDAEFLKKCGIYRVLNEFLDEVEAFVQLR